MFKAFVLASLVLLCSCDDTAYYADGTPWEPVVPFRLPRVPLNKLNDRELSQYFSQQGIQADQRVKTFTPTWGNDFSSDPVGDLSYLDFGRVVVMWNDTGNILVGTSDTTTLSFTALPDEITPDNNVILPTFVMDQGSAFAGQVSITSTGTVGFTLLSVSGSLVQAGVGNLFTASGNKGLPDGWLIVYGK